MNPQRTWRLLNFYSAGAVRNRGRTNAKLLQSQSHRTYNCIERGVAPSDTFFQLGLHAWCDLPCPRATYVRRRRPRFGRHDAVNSHTSAVKRRAVAAQGAPPAVQPRPCAVRRVPERRRGRGRYWAGSMAYAAWVRWAEKCTGKEGRRCEGEPSRAQAAPTHRRTP